MARQLVWGLGGVTLAAALAVVAWLAVSQSGDAPDPTPAPVVQGSLIPPAGAADPAPATQSMPAFDVVRVARDGAALVAGTAAPGAAVTLRVDGAVVAEAVADGAGQFVAMFSLSASEAAQVMTLEAVDASGGVLPAAESVLLTPRPAEPAAAVASVEAEVPPVAGDGAVAAPAALQATADSAPASASAEAPLQGAETASAAVEATAPPSQSVETVETDETAVAAETAASVPTALLLGGDGSVRVLDPGPVVFDTVIVDTISYSDIGDVQIAGRASSDSDPANVRIYLDNRPIAVTQAASGDWASDLPDVDPGIYTLRVDQLNAEGRVVSRFETPFQREAPEAVAAARALANGATPPAEPTAQQPATTEAPQPGALIAAVTGSAVPNPAPPPSVALITVQPGHTLWAISRDRYGIGEQYVAIFNANRSQIRDPDLIYPGQIFTLPGE